MAAAAPQEFVDHCLELLGALGVARARRMFGGHGIYVDGHFVALIAEHTLYLKADAEVQPQFAAAGCRPFEYRGRDDRRIVMAYWTAPQEAMESPAQMLPWARLAIASALRAHRPKPAATARKPSAAPRKTAAPPARKRARQS